ncbi:MAG TPA: nitrogenase component 1 [Syntrophomonas sp.]|nr:nitrogenase component 1 [Syntrophomonas sp.]
MSECVGQLRHVCSLGGMQTVVSIERAVPILHAGPGCMAKISGAVSQFNGSRGAGYQGGEQIPCTNLMESDVIFGGEEKLRSVIRNAHKIMDADIFVVLTSCIPEIVGDDVARVTKDFRDEKVATVYAETGGFNGTNYVGHEIVVDALIDQYLKPAAKKQPGLVNVWSVVPYQDPCWSGNYNELERLLTEIGLIPNIIFGYNRGLAALDRVPQAEFNLLVSPWTGLRNVKKLEEKFNTPFLHYPALPIGPTETGRFLRTVGSFAGLPQDHIEAVIEKHEREYYHYFETTLEVIYETRVLPNHFLTVADSFYALGIARFFINDMGMIPETQFVTDGVLPEYQNLVREEFRQFNYNLIPELVFSNDGSHVQEEIRKMKFKSRPLIIGSAWERELANEVGGYQASISMPVWERLIMKRFYVGYDGALNLLEDVYTSILSKLRG